MASAELSPFGNVTFLPGLEPKNSAVGGLGADTCTPEAFDSTRAAVTWGANNASLAAVAGTPVRLVFVP